MRDVLPIVNRLNKMGLFFLTEFFTKYAYYVKVNGFGACLKKILSLMAQVFIKHQEVVLFEKDLSHIPESNHSEPTVRIEMGRSNHIYGLTRLLPGWSSRIFQDRLSRGDIFFVARAGNQIVHQTWISFEDKRVPLLNKKIVLKEREAYLYQGYTALEYRGRHIFTAVVGKVLRHLKAQGYKKIIFLVDLKAPESKRACQRVIGLDAGTVISYWRILGFRNYRYQPYRRTK